MLAQNLADSNDSVFDASLILLATAPTATDSSLYQAQLNTLNSAQLTNGSWADDTFVTALALRALYSVQTAVPQNPELAAITGRVLDGQTGEPLSGAIVVINTADGQTLNVATNSEGYYAFNNLPSESITLSINYEGYIGVSSVLSLTAGKTQTYNIGLLKNPHAASIRLTGYVSDAESSTPLIDANVRIPNSAYQTLTDGQGYFELADIPAGGVSIEIAKSGYFSKLFSISAPTGGAFDLGNISLVPGGSPGNGSTVNGLITDAVTGLPLQGVLIAVSGTDTKSSYTGQDGRFTLGQVTAGNIAVTASLDGYRNATSSVTLPQGVNLEFNAALTQNTAPAVLSMQGQMIDGSTLAPLEGGAITIISANITKTAVTDAQGRFYLGGIDAGVIEAEFSAAGYTSLHYSITAEGSGLIDLSTIKLNPAPTDTPNLPPVINSAAATDASVGQLYEYRPQVVDPENQYLIFSLSGHPTGMNIDTETGAIKWIPTAEQVGDNQFTFVVSDSEGAVSTEQVTVTVRLNGEPGYIITDEQTLNSLTINKRLPPEYTVASYQSGGSGSWQSASPNGCGLSYVEAGNDSASLMEAASTIDFRGIVIGKDTDAVWDLGQPLANVSIASLLEPGPLPQKGVAYTVWGSNDPEAAFPDAWSLATLVTIYRSGWADNEIACGSSPNSDDYLGQYSFGGKQYRYIKLKAANSVTVFDTPEHTTFKTAFDDGDNDGWQSAASKIDAVLGMTCNGAAQADAGDDIVALTGEKIVFDATRSSGGISNYAWDIDGDNVVDLFGASPEYTFNAGFDRDVDLYVVDTEGCVAHDTIHVTVGLDYPKPDLQVSISGTDKVISNWQTLTVTGSVDLIVHNAGNAPVSDTVEVALFEDRNANGQYDSATDNVLGIQTTPSGVARNGHLTMTVPVNGVTQFRDSPILAMVDSKRLIDESHEDNNIATPAGMCVYQSSPLSEFDLAEKWYRPGEVYGPVNVVQLTDDNGDGIIDVFDKPDIVYADSLNLVAVDGSTGQLLWKTNGIAVTSIGSPSSADIDGDGIVEIVIVNSDRTKLYAFEHDGTLKWSANTGPKKGLPVDAVAIADIDHDGDVEIIHGRRAYDHAGKLLWEGAGDYGGETAYGTLPIIADLDNQGSMEIVAGQTVYNANGTIRWRRTDLPRSTGGFTAVGNFNQDENPEIVLVTSGRVYLLDSQGKTIWGPVTIPGGGVGGAPTVGDFDGDGQPEIGVAGATRYVVLETNGAVKWTSVTQDASSNRTGSSLFDFNLDGKAEVVYADELYLRIYDGATGKVLKRQRLGSGTTLEYPVIADVDGDGKAEIVVGSNNTRYSSRRGLFVFEDVNDNWAPTRSIWNQHSYHIDNINDDGTVPQFELASWLNHNTYRLNTFVDRDPSLLTDITASMLRIGHDYANQAASITVRIGNAGADDLSSRIAIAFYEGDPAANGRFLGSVPLDSLAVGQFQDVVLDNVATLTGNADIYAIADFDDRIPECNEANNRVVLPVLPQSLLGIIGVATDQTVYGPYSPVYLQAAITNASGVPGEFKAALSIVDDQGALVKQFDAQVVGTLAGGASQTLSEFWQTELYQAGFYRLRGQLYSQKGDLIDQSESAFEIRHAVNGEPLAALRTTTDKAVYHTTDNAQIFDLAQNLAVNRNIDDVVLQIRVDNPGGLTVFGESREIGTLISNSSRDFVSQFPLVQAAEGEYTATGELKTSSGIVLAQSQAKFEVRSDPLKQLSASVQAQWPTLEKGQLQTCTDTLTNTGSQNLMAQPVRQLLVNMDNGEIVLANEISVDVPSDSPYETARQIETGGLAVGAYACILQQRVDYAWYTLAHQTFALTEPPIKLEGRMSAGDRGRVLILLDDAPKQCSGFSRISLEAVPASPLSAGTSVTVSLYDAGDNLVDQESGVPDDRLIDQQAGNGGVNLVVDDIAPTHIAVSVAADTVLSTAYRIAIAAGDGSVNQVFDSGTMATDCSETLTIGTVYGDLRLTDVLKLPAANDPLGPNHVPDLGTQRSALEKVLTDAGWSYTVATDADGFTRELRSGGYAAYLLLSERIKLDEAVQKELREAVYRGEGLIEAGGHDQRQGRIDEALGVKFLGKHPAMQGISLLQNDWTPAGEAAFQLTDRTLKAVSEGAAVSGVFTDSTGSPTAETAVTIRTYGQGRSLYIGFDLAAELALAATGSPFENLLMDALTAVQSAEFKPVASGSYPLQLSLNNLGIATPGRILMTLPDGVGIPDPGIAAVGGQTLTWPFDLAEEQTLVFDAWLKLPELPVSLTASVQSGIDPDWVEQATLALNLAPEASVTVESVQQQAVLLTDKNYKQVQKYLAWAQADAQAERWADALAALLRAADALVPIATPESEALRLQVAKAILGIGRHIE